MGYETVDVMGDVGLRAWGETLQEAFRSAIAGMYGLITDLDSIEEKKSIEVSHQGDSPEGLLVGLLNELIYIFETEDFVGKRPEIEEFGEGRIKVRIFGEEFERERHPSGLLLKAATYHGLKVEKMGSRWQMEIIFDI